MSPTTQRLLLRAIEIMADACHDACHDARRSCGDDEDGARSCRQVLHAFAWGFANATASIETAMARIEDEHVIAQLEADQANKEPRK